MIGFGGSLKRFAILCWLGLGSGVLSSAVCAESLAGQRSDAGHLGVANANRARTNYMLNCQGCHGASGERSLDGAVPALRDYVGNFLHVPGGRAFLVQVPGSANAAISDAALAELLNWILQTQSAAQLPAQFNPFSTLEVQQLRQHPLADVIGTRAALVREIEQTP